MTKLKSVKLAPSAIASPKATYRGRFAPSPSGPLHFGSLCAALASWLDARSNAGQWLLRIEDIDPPREVAGSALHIQQQLKAHGLWWDEAVFYQHTRTDAYSAALVTLEHSGRIYPCNCTRARLRELPAGRYDRHCLTNTPSGICALRYCAEPASDWLDLIQGPQFSTQDLGFSDPVLKRKDGLFAYQLAVVVDDIEQGITHVIRGDDLIEMTPNQQQLFSHLGARPPEFGHIPVVLGPDGKKLSKQHHAPSIDGTLPSTNLIAALRTLGLQWPDAANAKPEQILDWAVKNWRYSNVGNSLHRYT